FSDDDALLAAGGADGSLHVWDARAGKVLGGTADTPGTATDISLSPDGKQLVSVHGKTLRAWNVASGAIVLEERGELELRAVAYATNGELLAIGGHGVELLDTATGMRQFLPEGPGSPVLALAVAPAAPIVAAGSTASADVWLWDIQTGEPVLIIPDAIP